MVLRGQDFKLDSTYIYSHVGRRFAQRHLYHNVRQLLGCVKDSGMCTDQSFDEVIGACVRAIANETTEVRPAQGRDHSLCHQCLHEYMGVFGKHRILPDDCMITLDEH